MTPAGLAAFAAAATALAALALAAATGGPYLSSDGVNGWICVFALALLAALLAAPLWLERRLRERRGEDGEGGLRRERWEGAALAWGGISALVLLVSVPLGLSESFAGDSLLGSAALFATIEAGLVLATLLLWLLAG